MIVEFDPPPYPSSGSVSRSRVSRASLSAHADAMLRRPAHGALSTGSDSSSPPAYTPTSSNFSSMPGSPASSSRRGAVLPTAMPSRTSHATSSASLSRVGSRGAVASMADALLQSQRAPRLSNSSAVAGSTLAGSRTSASPAALSAMESRKRLDHLSSAGKQASASKAPVTLSGIFKASCSTDILFLIDSTSSMQPYIDAAKRQVKDIVATINSMFFNEATLPIAIVAYRDHSRPSAVSGIEHLDFTTDTANVHAFLDKLRARGGGDAPEDVLGGIDQALSMSWTQNTRVMIHIADQPGHSTDLNKFDAKYDEYPIPGSEPHGLKYKPLIKMMTKLGIHYTMLSITKGTDYMIAVFAKEYAATGAEVKLLESNKYLKWYNSEVGNGARHSGFGPRLILQEAKLGTDTHKLCGLVVKSVSDSVSNTVLSRNFDSKTGKTLALKSPPPPKLDLSRPQWDAPGWLDKTWQLEGYCPDVIRYHNSTLSDMMASDDGIKLSVVQLTVHARSMPFAHGAYRAASYARTAASSSRFVVKRYFKGAKTLACLAEDMRMQALCKAFALEFNGILNLDPPLDFMPSVCLHSPASAEGSAEEATLLTLEPFIEGTYEKYNNNAFWVRDDTPDDTFNRIAQAFSHFTFERSFGRFMVIDLQGVGTRLTDPAIHTADPDRFTLCDSNLGKEGFKSFFAMHFCNDVCRKLGLQSSRDQIRDSKPFVFRERWPAMEPTVCCANELCHRIVRLADTWENPRYPGHRWCGPCWVQLGESMTREVCAGPGALHEFDVCRFYDESQGRITPRDCPEHRAKDMSASSPMAAAGGLWSQRKVKSKTSVAGMGW